MLIFINHVKVSHLKIFKISDFFSEISICQKRHENVHIYNIFQKKNRLWGILYRQKVMIYENLEFFSYVNTCKFSVVYSVNQNSLL